MNKHRELDEVPGSDADFWRVDLENEEIDYVEVKTSDKEVKDQDGDIEEKMDQDSIQNADLDFDPDSIADNQSRRQRQIQRFNDAVDYANEQVGTNFVVNKEAVSANDILDPEDEPEFYTGDYHLADGIEPADLEKLEGFVNELMVDMSMEEADRIETVSPEEWVKAI